MVGVRLSATSAPVSVLREYSETDARHGARGFVRRVHAVAFRAHDNAFGVTTSCGHRRGAERGEFARFGAGKLRDRTWSEVVRYVYAFSVWADGKVVGVSSCAHRRWAQRGEFSRFGVSRVLRDRA